MHPSVLVLCLTLALAGGVLASRAADPVLHVFRRLQLSDQFWGEGASFGDFNRDGVHDVVSGPW
jgi:hypothetical protein